MPPRSAARVAFVLVSFALVGAACHDDAPASPAPVGSVPPGAPFVPDAAPANEAGTPDASVTDAADASLDAEAEDLDAGPPGPTFRYVHSIFRANCSTACHLTSSFPSGGLGMATRAEAYRNLVGVDCTANRACSGRKRVVPNDPAASVLYTKIARSPLCGDPMPPEAGKELSSDQIALVQAWIAAGAPND